MNMELTFLGTASHSPTEKRNHTGMLVEFSNEMMLVDCGEGMQRQFKIAKKNACKLTKLLITHWHGDHTLGIPGLLQTLAMSEYQKELHIYGPRGTKKKIELIEKLYGRIKIQYKVHEITQAKTIDCDSFEITTESMTHGIASLAYAITIKDKRRIHKDKIMKLKIGHSPKIKDLQAGKDITIDGKKIKAKDLTYIQPGKKIAIIMDTSMNSNAVKLAKNADLLVCESTYHPEEKQLAKERDHLTAHDAATIAKKAKVAKLALTHLSQRYAARPKELLQEAKKVFKNTVLPKDFDTITI